MKLIEKNIGWLVTIAVVFITTFGFLNILISALDNRILNLAIKVFPLLILYFIFLFQKRRYGIKIFDRSFFFFYLVYCFYVLLDITLFRRYPLDSMIAVPKSLFIYIYDFVISIGYIICAKTIVNHFNTKKFLLLSLVVCSIPSYLFIQFLGVDVIQTGITSEDEELLNTLAITYTNMPILVLAVMNINTLFTKKILSIIVCLFIISLTLYVLFVFGKRGPLLWSFVSILFCIVIKSSSIKKYIVIFGFIVGICLAFLDSILEVVKETLPMTGERIEMAIKEGNTNGRFNVEDSKHSTYLIGLENFTRSPIWGYYFRLVTNYQHYRGSYAHNVFIEILMTMGLFGFIPFVLFLLKACRKSRRVLVRNNLQIQMACLIFFLCSFLRLQTTGTCVFNFSFWLFLYILCCLDVIGNARSSDVTKSSSAFTTIKY